jgi:hypothetical protein
LGYGEVQRNDDTRTDVAGIVEHEYRGIKEPTVRVVRVILLCEGKSGDCTTVRHIALTPPHRSETIPPVVPAPIITTFSPSTSTLRHPNLINATIKGQFFSRMAVVFLIGTPSGITIFSTKTIDSETMQLDFTVEPFVPFGTTFDVRVMNPDGQFGTLRNAFTAM